MRLSNRGADYLRAGEAGKALTLLRRAHQLLPDDVPTAINLSGSYILMGRHKEAIPILERALAQEPENEMIWTNLGAAYLGNPILADEEQQCRAIEAFERAIETNSVVPNVHYNLGLIHRDRDEIDQALLRFRQAVQANPNDQDARRAQSRLEKRDDTPEQQSDGRTGH